MALKIPLIAAYKDFSIGSTANEEEVRKIVLCKILRQACVEILSAANSRSVFGEMSARKFYPAQKELRERYGIAIIEDVDPYGYM